jgi:outer membrane protein TolC
LIESQVILDVRRAIRNLKTSATRVATARTTRELAEKQLANEENKFRAGLIALFQVQDTEQELTEARINETNTLLDYQRALVELLQAQGDLWSSLRKYDIQLDIKKQAATRLPK